MLEDNAKELAVVEARRIGLHRLAALVCVTALAQSPSTWRLTRSQHFEVYSQGGGDSARSTLAWFEQLRGFFQKQTGVNLDHLPPVRVIVFGSRKEYQPYRLGPTSDAYSVSTASRNYIVMAALDTGELQVGAHEYAHLILQTSGLQRPAWLNEGLAEFFSTVRIGARGSTLGGAMPANAQILRRREWMPLADLVALPQTALEDREKAELFYAQSWALTEMLVLSPDYGDRFRTLMAALTLKESSLHELTAIYGKSAGAITHDVRAWVEARDRITPVALPGVTPPAVAMELSTLSSYAAQSVLADLVLVSGQLDRAEALYRDLAKEAPESADISAALGTIALRKGEYDRARYEWKRAIAQGVGDATLCYQYAILAGMAALPADEIRPALERAVALDPHFDDARYSLALLEKNAGHYEPALEQLHAMRSVTPARAYTYWLAIADSLKELDRREESIAAAKQAARHAATAAERAQAVDIEYMAQTDLAVVFTRDENGRPRMVTTRSPHNATNWNPFIEPGDDIRRVQGTLREIDCNSKMTRILVDTDAGPLKLAIPDPSHVQMRNAPAEFTCGPQPSSPVTAEYAASKPPGSNGDGVVRGLAFR